MTSIRYKGFDILPRPYQLHASKRWTVDLEIRCDGRKQHFSGLSAFVGSVSWAWWQEWL